MIVGLTGGIGAGKTTVLAMFQALGVPTYNADTIAKDIMDSNPAVTKAVQKKFPSVIDKQKIDRKKIRQIIFNSVEDKKWLEDLLHPLVKQEIKNIAQQHTHDYCVVEIPLLFEANMTSYVDKVLTIDTPHELQLQRSMQRDAAAAEEIAPIIASQITREFRLSNSDDVITNDDDLQLLQSVVMQLHKKYRGYAN